MSEIAELVPTLRVGMLRRTLCVPGIAVTGRAASSDRTARRCMRPQKLSKPLLVGPDLLIIILLLILIPVLPLNWGQSAATNRPRKGAVYVMFDENVMGVAQDRRGLRVGLRLREVRAARRPAYTMRTKNSRSVR